MKHVPLVKFVLKGFRGVPKISREDLFQEGCLAVVEALRRYDPSKGALSTYLVSWIRFRMMVYLNEKTSVVHVPKNISGRKGFRSIRGELYEDWKFPVREDVETGVLVSQCLDTLDEREKELMTAWMCDVSLSDTARKWGLSRQRTQQIFLEAVQKMKHHAHENHR